MVMENCMAVFNLHCIVLSGVMVSMLVIGPTVHGFKPGRERWIFIGNKIPQHAFLRR
jgi:hypothetical protein